MPSPASFHLKKWYFDGVSDDGRALIGYSARLRWNALEVHYASYLYLPAAGPARSESRYRGAEDPEIKDQTIRWGDKRLGVQGEWVCAAAPLRARLHESEAGWLDWHCHQPVSRCRIELQGEPPIEGWGYAECLEMTLPPWKLDFDELRWGRFAHPDNPLVWIELKGADTRRWVFDGAGLASGSSVSDTAISVAGGQKTLLLEAPAVIEEEQKFAAVLRELDRWLPGFDRITPLQFLRARETKWRSAGVLLVDGAVQQRGWVIHELVKI